MITTEDRLANANACIEALFNKGMALVAENERLREQLAEREQTLEDVCLGGGIKCITCGKTLPWCDCDKIG